MPNGPSPLMLASLVGAQEAMRENLGNEAVQLAAQAAVNNVDWYDAGAVFSWAQELAGNIQAVLANIAGLTEAHLSTLISELTGKWVRSQPPIQVDDLRNGPITHAEAYARAASAYRYQQSRLDKATVALASVPDPKVPKLHSPQGIAVNRVKAIAGRDVQLTVVRQSQKTISAAGDAGLVTGWRRMVRPELSRDGTCGLCIAASTRIYKTGDLMFIHDHCNCLPVPITATHDPGLRLDREAFAQLYGDAGGTTREALKKTRYQVTENGELGPVLAPAGARQRTPSVVKAATQPARPMSDTRKDRTLTGLRGSLQRSLPRIEQLAAADDTGRWAAYRQTVTDRIEQIDQQLTAA